MRKFLFICMDFLLFFFIVGAGFVFGFACCLAISAERANTRQSCTYELALQEHADRQLKECIDMNVPVTTLSEMFENLKKSL